MTHQPAATTNLSWATIDRLWAEIVESLRSKERAHLIGKKYAESENSTWKAFFAFFGNRPRCRKAKRLQRLLGALIDKGMVLSTLPGWDFAVKQPAFKNLISREKKLRETWLRISQLLSEKKWYQAWRQLKKFFPHKSGLLNETNCFEKVSRLLVEFYQETNPANSEVVFIERKNCYPLAWNIISEYRLPKKGANEKTIAVRPYVRYVVMLSNMLAERRERVQPKKPLRARALSHSEIIKEIESGHRHSTKGIGYFRVKKAA